MNYFKEYISLILERSTGEVLNESFGLTGEDDFEDMFGEVMFGDSRGLGEPDTIPEENLESMLGDWYQGYGVAADLFKDIVALRDSEMYDDVFAPPYGKTAYRIIIIPWADIKSRLSDTEPFTSVKLTPWSGLEEEDGLEPPEAVAMGYKMAPGSLSDSIPASWTIDSSALMRVHDSMKGLARHAPYGVSDLAIVIMEAEVSDAFVLNPAEMDKVSPYNEEEVVQVEPVRLSGGNAFRVFMSGVEVVDFKEVMNDLIDLILQHYSGGPPEF